MINLTAPQKSSSVELRPNSVYLGTVTRIEGNTAFVEVPQVAAGFSFGPCLIAAGDVSVVVQTTTTKNIDGVVTEVQTTVTKTRIPPPVGGKVLCTFLNGSIDELVVLGSIL
jgi:hypothetical protein